MKKIIIAIIILAVALGGVFVGLKLFLASSRPDLNGNENIISTALKSDGTPKDVLGDARKITVSKDIDEVYLSIPVNSKDMTKCHVILSFEGKKLDDAIITISDARYVTYHFKNLKEKESGLYQFAFYDSEDKLNVYSSITLE